MANHFRNTGLASIVLVKNNITVVDVFFDPREIEDATLQQSSQDTPVTVYVHA